MEHPMNLRSNPLVIRLRSVTRAIGLNSLIMRFMGDKTYEARFDEAFFAHVNAGDCVWDVGANRGLYTERLAARVGANGRVIAFEPVPSNHQALIARCSALANVTVLQMALGREDGSAQMEQGADAIGATSRIISGPRSTEQGGGAAVMSRATVEVPVRAGAGLVRSGAAPLPQAVKIDVEGHELDCLTGLEPLLAEGGLRAIGMEIHFGILADRGESDAPRKIEQMLSRAGFTVTWSDPSHIVAHRN
jgi:FkbM family methyltransferase